MSFTARVIPALVNGKNINDTGSEMMGLPPILWEKRGHIRILTLNRPEKMNALNLEGEKLHGEYLKEFQQDDDAWVLIYTGTGKAFSTGLDLAEMQHLIGTKKMPVTLAHPDAPEIWKPIIAAINGYALGGGCELALATDIRIAADDARIGLPEVKRSLIPGAGGCQRLPRAISPGDALKLLFTGDYVDAQEAFSIGLVQQIVPREHLLDAAVELAERICQNGPLAVQAVKEAVYRGMNMPLRAALAQDRLISFRNRQSDDAKEGPKAFIEKRKPAYKGR